jgi:hypothetical protein
MLGSLICYTDNMRREQAAQWDEDKDASHDRVVASHSRALDSQDVGLDLRVIRRGDVAYDALS